MIARHHPGVTCIFQTRGGIAESYTGQGGGKRPTQLIHGGKTAPVWGLVTCIGLQGVGALLSHTWSGDLPASNLDRPTNLVSCKTAPGEWCFFMNLCSSITHLWIWCTWFFISRWDISFSRSSWTKALGPASPLGKIILRCPPSSWIEWWQVRWSSDDRLQTVSTVRG